MDIYTTREVLKNNLTSIFDLNLRVAYYARVSTEKDQKITGYLSMVILMMVFLQSVPPSEKNFNGWF